MDDGRNYPEKDSFIKKMREDLDINEADALILALSETIDEQVFNKYGISYFAQKLISIYALS